MVGVIFRKRQEILRGDFAGDERRVGRRRFGWILGGVLGRVEQRERDRGRGAPVVPDEAPAHADNAADTVRVFVAQVGRYLFQLAVLQPKVSVRVAIGDRVRLALVDRGAQQGRRKLLELDIGRWVEAALWITIEKKFLAGEFMSLTAMVLLLRSETSLIPESAGANRRMQPPWRLAMILTSKPCSIGFSQRSAVPTAASALPVARVSSS
jgi:hypothetical protein